jgi:hypothetical protein
MKRCLRYLRIAFSATCLIACVLLTVLWVRSNYWIDQITVPVTQSSSIGLLSVPNAFIFELTDARPTVSWDSGTAEEWIANVLKYQGVTWSDAPRFKITERAVRSPYWFLLLLSATFAAVPWLRWRFTLRTLLIATTLVAVVLGFVAWVART